MVSLKIPDTNGLEKEGCRISDDERRRRREFARTEKRWQIFREHGSSVDSEDCRGDSLNSNKHKSPVQSERKWSNQGDLRNIRRTARREQDKLLYLWGGHGILRDGSGRRWKVLCVWGQQAWKGKGRRMTSAKVCVILMAQRSLWNDNRGIFHKTAALISHIESALYLPRSWMTILQNSSFAYSSCTVDRSRLVVELRSRS